MRHHFINHAPSAPLADLGVLPTIGLALAGMMLLWLLVVVTTLLRLAFLRIRLRRTTRRARRVAGELIDLEIECAHFQRLIVEIESGQIEAILAG